jgi:uncharacterized protein YgbK (DUF1537 family)
MVATTMVKITSLIRKLEASYSQPNLSEARIIFQTGNAFHWNHLEHTLTYDPMHPHAAQYIFHELAHATLGHQGYTNSVQLLEMERDAWQHASQLAHGYGVTIEDDVVQESLDSYRDWLHQRSLCPHCAATGVESAMFRYTCLACGHSWLSNEARNCALRRRSKNK